MGTLSMNIDGSIHEMNVLNFSISIDIADISRAELGNIVTQHKSGLMNLSDGSMEVYTGDTVIMAALRNYKNTHKQPPMTITCTNDDLASDLPVKTVTILGVQITHLPLASLDSNADILQDTLSFVANDFEIL
jgi:hypothetical protein